MNKLDKNYHPEVFWIDKEIYVFLIHLVTNERWRKNMPLLSCFCVDPKSVVILFLFFGHDWYWSKINIFVSHDIEWATIVTKLILFYGVILKQIHLTHFEPSNGYNSIDIFFLPFCYLFGLFLKLLFLKIINHCVYFSINRLKIFYSLTNLLSFLIFFHFF